MNSPEMAPVEEEAVVPAAELPKAEPREDASFTERLKAMALKNRAVAIALGFLAFSMAEPAVAGEPVPPTVIAQMRAHFEAGLLHTKAIEPKEMLVQALMKSGDPELARYLAEKDDQSIVLLVTKELGEQMAALKMPLPPGDVDQYAAEIGADAASFASALLGAKLSELKTGEAKQVPDETLKNGWIGGLEAKSVADLGALYMETMRDENPITGRSTESLMGKANQAKVGTAVGRAINNGRLTVTRAALAIQLRHTDPQAAAHFAAAETKGAQTP